VGPASAAGRLWRAIERAIPVGSFARSVAVMGGGTGLSYALVLAVSPIVTRLYTPPDFGLLGVYMSMVSMSLVFVSWRYELAIPAPKEDTEATSVLVLAMALVVGTSAMIGGALWAIGGLIVDSLDAPELRPYLWLVPVNTLIGGVYAVLYSWCVRKKAFAAIARSKLSQAVGTITAHVGLGLLFGGALGLVVGHIVRWGGGSVTLFRDFWRDSAGCRKRISLRGTLTMASRYRRFPMFTVWSALLGNCGTQMPVLLLSAFFGSVPAGLYVLTGQVLWMPLNVVALAISQVFFSSASEASRGGKAITLTLRVFTRLVAVGTPFIMLLMVAAPEGFALLFGPKWTMAGVYAQFLCPWLLLAFAVGPVTSLVYVLEHQHGELVFQACLLVGRVAALVMGGLLGDPVLAIALFGGVSAAMWFVYMLWLLHVSGNRPRDGLICLGKNLAATLPVLLPTAAAKLVFDTPLWVVGGAAISAAWAAVNVVRGLRRRDATPPDAAGRQEMTPDASAPGVIAAR
jgi:O-antigen/teichoic acid export membrane protein